MLTAETLLQETKISKMKLTQKKIEKIVSALVGEEAVPIVNLLLEEDNLSEFIIAEKLEWEISKVRKILYKLHNFGLAVYKRKKDRKKGWYISYWTFKKENIKPLLEKLKKERLEHLEERLKKEEKNKGNFYLCPSGCVRLNFDEAAEHNFKCPDCGRILSNQDNTRTIEFLKEKIAALKE